MSPEQMAKLLELHGESEFTGDVEATMATVSSDPCWELYPNGYVVSGTDAVRELYRRLVPFHAITIPTTVPRSAAQQIVEVDGVGVPCPFPDGRTRLVHAHTMADGEFTYTDPAGGVGPIVMRFATVLTFDNERILGERGYVDGAASRLLEQTLGEDFIRIPGVTRVA